MPAPVSNDDLTDVILKSGVIEEGRLRAYVKKLADSESGLPPDPNKLGGLMVRDGILTYFQAEQLLQGKWKRFFIGKYKVLERLGVGGMGQVFLCEHKLMKRKVAVKVLPAAKSNDEAALSRFYREARAVAAVDHPNLVRAYDIDQDENLHFLVMEFVDGTNLHDLVRKFGPVDVLRACHYIFGSVVGLHHAHEMGLVHRDIKPANILVDRTGVVKILDMGLARFFHPDEDDNLTKKFDESVLGTADYLAPEQAIDSSSVDIRADIYGLGGTFYYMLTGFPPFPEGSVAQKLLWHQTKAPKAVRVYRPEIPEGVAAIVDKMMAKDASQRYQSPAELMEALAPWVQTPIPPPPDAEMPQMSLAASGGVPGRAAPGSGPSLNTSLGSNPIYTTPAPAQSKTELLPATIVAQPFAGAPPVARAAPPTPAPLYSPAPVAAATAVAVGIPAVWESLGGAETIRNSDGNTGTKPRPAESEEDEDEAPPKPSRTARGSGMKKPGSKKMKFAPVLILAGVGLFAFVGIAVAGLFVWKPWAKVETVSTHTSDGRKVYVTSSGQSPDPTLTRKTLREAIGSARSGDTIVLLDSHYESPALRLQGSARIPLKNVRIESGPNGPATWTFKLDPALKDASTQAALELLNVEDVTVEGIIFELGGTAHAGLYAAGTCPGLTYQNVTVRNPKTSGFRIHNLTADAARPMRIIKARVSGTARYEAGVSIHSSPNLSNQSIHILDGRFEGPAKDAFEIEGAATGIEIRNNRVLGFDTGLHIVGALAPEKALAVKLERNTFQSLGGAGIALDGPLANAQHIAVERNYFANVPALVRAANPIGIQASENARDAAAKEGPVNLAAVQIDGVTLSSNKENDGEFLRPNGGAKMPTLAGGKTPVGAE